jgi:hypothetical protein
MCDVKKEKLTELSRCLSNTTQALEYVEKKHKAILKKRSYHKFKKGPVFYIISDCD